MPLLQHSGMGESISQQLTTIVTPLEPSVPSLQTKVSAHLVNVLNV